MAIPACRAGPRSHSRWRAHGAYAQRHRHRYHGRLTMYGLRVAPRVYGLRGLRPVGVAQSRAVCPHTRGTNASHHRNERKPTIRPARISRAEPRGCDRSDCGRVLAQVLDRRLPRRRAHALYHADSRLHPLRSSREALRPLTSQTAGAACGPRYGRRGQTREIATRRTLQFGADLDLIRKALSRDRCEREIVGLHLAIGIKAAKLARIAASRGPTSAELFDL